MQSMRQLIARCHLHTINTIKMIGATLTPYAGAGYYVSAGAATREAVNQWILTSGALDAVVDFARVTGDPAQPDRFLAAYDSGDHFTRRTRAIRRWRKLRPKLLSTWASKSERQENQDTKIRTQGA
jgi:hypothetical protein